MSKKYRDFKECPVCKKYHWTNDKCKPIYLVWHEDYMGDDSKEVRADSLEDAALEYGNYYNSDGDYSLMNEEIKVKVQKKGDEGNFKYFIVGAEPSIHYSSKEIEESDFVE